MDRRRLRRRRLPSLAEPPESTGSEARFESMFAAHADEVFGFFARRVGRAEAADLTAETFKAAWTAWSRFDRDAADRPWLFGIARNLLGHRFRSDEREQRALGRVAVGTERASVVDGVDDRVDAGRAWDGVSAALAALAPIDREALLLLAWEDLSYGEIAAVTAVPIGTVRSRINRARRQLRAQLDGQDGREGTDQLTVWTKENW